MCIRDSDPHIDHFAEPVDLSYDAHRQQDSLARQPVFRINSHIEKLPSFVVDQKIFNMPDIAICRGNMVADNGAHAAQTRIAVVLYCIGSIILVARLDICLLYTSRCV